MDNNVLKQARIVVIVALASVLAVASTQAFAQSRKPEPTYMWQANDSDILEVIKFVQEVTGKTMVVDPRVKGRVKIMSNEALTADEMYALFRTILETSDYAVVEVGNVVRIVPIKDARGSPTKVNPTTRGDDSEYVTEVIQLKNINAAKVIPTLRPMIPQNAHVSAYDPSNALVVTDSVANIEKIKLILEKIDREALPSTEIVELRFADADETVQTLTKLDASQSKGAPNSNQLVLVADSRNNAILMSGDEVKRQKAKELIKALDKPPRQQGNVRVVYLEYADAKEVATVLSKLVQNISKASAQGKGGKSANNSASKATVEADEATNALLITASGDMLESLISVIHRLDIRRAQVLVEAIIVELNEADDGTLGLEWLFANENEGIFGGSSRGSGSPLSVAGGLLGGNSSSSESGSNSTLAALAAGITGNQGQLLGLAGTTGVDKFAAILTALKKNNKANILSTPSLLTMDNKEATISVGQSVPFRTGSFTSTGNTSQPSNPFTTIQREDVGVSLTVTPQVNEGDKVLLEIAQEVSSLSNAVEGSADLITNQSTISTQILAGDGELIVLGGLIKESASDNETRVPFLGSIPILGNFFKTQGGAFAKSNLVVFLRARIIRDDESMRGATAEKYRLIREAQQRQKDQGLKLLNDDLIPVLPELTLEEVPDSAVVSGDEEGGE